MNEATCLPPPPLHHAVAPWRRGGGHRCDRSHLLRLSPAVRVGAARSGTWADATSVAVAAREEKGDAAGAWCSSPGDEVGGAGGGPTLVCDVLSGLLSGLAPDVGGLKRSGELPEGGDRNGRNANVDQLIVPTLAAQSYLWQG
ncbi:unnamed protein product [Lampetra planeri]